MVHISFKKKVKGPLYLELKDMLVLIDSLKEENKLWASRCKRNGVDLFLSSIILWFTNETYEKLGLAGEIKSSYETLKSLLEVKLLEVKKLSDTSLEDLLEVLQCVATLMDKYSDKNLDLMNKLYAMFIDEFAYLVGIVKTYSPYNTHLPSLIVLAATYMYGNRKLESSKLKEVISSYLENVEKVEEHIDSSTLYWVITTLSKFLDLKVNNNYIGKTISVLKHVETIIIKNLISYKDRLEHLPLDKTLWYYHILEKYIQVLNKLELSTDPLIKKLYNAIMKRILKVGTFLWKKTAYGELLYGLRKSYGSLTSKSLERSDMDLVTLSLLIGAYEKMKKHVVTYVTDYDLERLTKIKSLSLAAGLILVILGTALITYTLITYSSTRMNVFTLIPSLAFSIYVLSSGVNVLYSLFIDKVKSYKDLVKVILPIISKAFM